MKKLQKVISILSIFLIFVFVGCTKEIEVKEQHEIKPSKYYSIYTEVLDSYMGKDPGLESGMKYIAIDLESLKNAEEKDKENILKYFAKYNLEVKGESFKTLKEKGMVKEGNYIEGLLLSVENVEFVSDSEVIIEGSKFRSGTGALGFKSVVKYDGEKWVLKETKETWIS